MTYGSDGRQGRADRPGPSGRELGRPRTRGEAVWYLTAFVALYGGVIAVLVLDAAGPTCSSGQCASFHPGIRWALGAAIWGFLALVLLAVRLTRAAGVAKRFSGRPSARGWPLAWNYLAAGLLLPAAIRLLFAKGTG